MKSNINLAPVISSHINNFFTNKKEVAKTRIMNLLRRKENKLHLYINGKKGSLFLTTKTRTKYLNLHLKLQRVKTSIASFHILRRIILTNDFLPKINVKESPVYSFCKRANETIEHLFVDCYYVKVLWELCEKWLLWKF